MAGPEPDAKERDRYQEATFDIAEHLGGKLWTTLQATIRTPENQARLQSVLDPVVSHIIGRIFPYILLSAILFLILFLLSVGTFWMVLRTMSSDTRPVGVVTGKHSTSNDLGLPE
jgi:hypothetical protein